MSVCLASLLGFIVIVNYRNVETLLIYILDNNVRLKKEHSVNKGIKTFLFKNF